MDLLRKDALKLIRPESTGLIRHGPSEPASYNDDSSPDTRKVSGEKIPIEGQVIPGESLDWYHCLLQLCPSWQGELEAPIVWELFRLAGNETRNRIWLGLSKVRIHITDPRQYRKDMHEIGRKIFKVDDVDKHVDHLIQTGQPLGRYLWTQNQLLVAKRILGDSLGERLRRTAWMVNDMLSWDLDEHAIDLDDFKVTPKSAVRLVSAWSAKSASAFHDTLDALFDPSMPPMMRKRMMERRLSKSHTFDEGNKVHIDLLEKMRHGVLRSMSDFPYEMNYIPTPQPQQYTQIKSADSYFVQAADMAAGIASRIFEQDDLIGVVSRFEYVTYNGRRVSRADAEEEMKWLNR
jgi:hypothetical protein